MTDPRHDFTLPDCDPFMDSCARIAGIADAAARAYTRTGQHREAQRALQVKQYAEGRYLARGLELLEADDASA
jgi:hypothetical protein